MCSRASLTNWVLAATLGFGAGAVRADEALEAEYERLIQEELERTSDEAFTERFASGLAAIGIGLYGYYNDDRGLLTKVVYSSTQTAGILLVSEAIAKSRQPSLLLLTDRYLGRKGAMDMGRFRRAVVSVERRRQTGEMRQQAYTSAILAAVYGYNGFRESTGYSGLKNVFYFLSFNFTVVSGASFYRMFSGPAGAQTAGLMDRVELAMVPWPTVTVRF